MKFQDFLGSRVTVGTKKMTDARTYAHRSQQQYAPATFFKVGGIMTILLHLTDQSNMLFAIRDNAALFLKLANRRLLVNTAVKLCLAATGKVRDVEFAF